MIPRQFSLRAETGSLATASILFWCSLGFPAVAEEPHLKVTILILEETEVCQPNGYANYSEADGSRQCEPLTIAQVENWLRTDAPRVTHQIPPNDKPISVVPVWQFLNRYLREDPGKDPKQRSAALFLFDWGAPQTFRLTFRRQSTKGRIPSSRTRVFNMKEHRRWIHHERADSIAPVFEVTWRLDAGNQTIVLSTTGKNDGS